MRRLGQIRDWACDFNRKNYRTNQLGAKRLEEEDDIELKRRREAAAKGIILVGRL